MSASVNNNTGMALMSLPWKSLRGVRVTPLRQAPLEDFFGGIPLPPAVRWGSCYNGYFLNFESVVLDVLSAGRQDGTVRSPRTRNTVPYICR